MYEVFGILSISFFYASQFSHFLLSIEAARSLHWPGLSWIVNYEMVETKGAQQ